MHLLYFPCFLQIYTWYSWCMKHESHIRYLTYILKIYRFGQLPCSLKHTIHCCCTFCIPSTQILIEFSSPTKGLIEILYLTYIPIWNISSIKISSTFKHWIHICHITRIHTIWKDNILCFKILKQWRSIIWKLYSLREFNLTHRKLPQLQLIYQLKPFITIDLTISL